MTVEPRLCTRNPHERIERFWERSSRVPGHSRPPSSSPSSRHVIGYFWMWDRRSVDTYPPTSPVVEENGCKHELIPRLRQVLAPQVTPAVELLLSSNYDQYDHFPEGTVVEICPDALCLIQDVSKFLYFWTVFD